MTTCVVRNTQVRTPISLKLTYGTPATAGTARGSWSTCRRQVNMTEGTCAHCGAPASRKYCSTGCYHLATRQSERVAVTCPCGTVFETSANRAAAGRGKHCSKACMYRYRTRPSGLEYNVTKENPTSFKPGHVPWSKGTKGLVGGHTPKGVHYSPDTEFKPGQNAGEANVRWAGDGVGYFGLHARVYRALGRAAEYPCAHADETCKGPMNWANISGQYRDVDDFMPLCMSHHARYDEAGVRG